jgi:GrpB-like predicted nucleotidyltransferase (UPF0157 family)
MLHIEPYQSEWVEEFAAIASEIRRGLQDLALRIDHIGSTAVAGLAAKDVIDLQVTVQSLDEDVAAAVLALGFTRPEGTWQDDPPPGFTGPLEEWQKLLFTEKPGARRSNIHVRVLGRANQRYALLFRDFLRAHPMHAQAYANLKALLVEHLADPARYPEVKQPAVHLLHFDAHRWAQETGWQPGPPDA